MKMGGIDKKYIIIGISAVIVLGLGIFLSVKFGLFGSNGQNGAQCDVPSGVWVPQQGECQNNQSLQNQCNAFCSAYPDCCPGWSGNYTSSLGGPGQTLLPLPSQSEIASLTRNYPTTIKAINGGPNIYSRVTAQKVISDEDLDEMKNIGFNTVQIILIGKWGGDKIVFNDYNNAVLLNDIVAIKKRGLAVWIALDIGGGPPVEGLVLADSYEKFKPAYLNLVNLSSSLMEEYKVEYLTVNNEGDMFFSLQTDWGTESQINNYLIDFYPANNELARKNFHGKLINKMTQPDKRTNEFLSATFENVDIAGVDVGPAMSGEHPMSLENYKAEFSDYQLYATKASAAGVPWMNAEYWQKDFDLDADSFVKEHELAYANVSFNAYLAVTPKGKGYTWNELSMFSIQPNGEETRQAMKDFLEKI